MHVLATKDRKLNKIVKNRGAPPFWRRPPGYETLVLMILEQQVSLMSAQAVFQRLKALVSPLTPGGYLEASDASLKKIGLTRQKRRYCKELARAIDSSQLDLRNLSKLDDSNVCGELTKVVGIGQWTAHVYLAMAMRRPDIWPTGDRALVLALQDLYELSQTPTVDEAEQLGERWRPYRSVATRILWHEYLCARGRGEGFS